MISNINPIQQNNHPVFKSAKLATSTGYAVVLGKSGQQLTSLKRICKEILLRTNEKKELATAVMTTLGGLKFTETAITLFENDKDSIRLSMPRGTAGNLFKVQLIKNEKPTDTILVDNFNKIVDTYSLNTIKYKNKKDVNNEILDATINSIFETLDEPLLKIRKFVQKNISEISNTNEKLLQITVPKSEEIKKQTETNQIFVPQASDWEQFSMSEIIRQNASKLKNIEQLEKKSKNKHDSEVEKQKTRPRANINLIKISEKKSLVNKTEKKESKNTTTPKVSKQKVLKTKPIKTKKYNAKETLPDGFLNKETKEKINEIFNLQNELINYLKSQTFPTVLKIRNAFNGVKTKLNKFIFGSLIISTPKRKEYSGLNILNLNDSTNNSTYNILDSGKIISKNVNWAQSGPLPKLKFLSQNEIDKTQRDEKFNSTINSALANLREFKNFIDEKKWITPKATKQQKTLKNKVVIKQEPTELPVGFVEKSTLSRINAINEKQEKIKNLLASIPLRRARDIKENFGELEIMRSSSRLEFKNPFGDCDNLTYNHTATRYGEMFFIIKYNKQKPLQDVFVVTPDGNVLKSFNKKSGINQVLPTNPNQILKFYNIEELKQGGLEQRLNLLLDMLDEKLTQYNDFITDSISQKNKPKLAPISYEKKISISSVKDFMIEVIDNMQKNAGPFAQISECKSALDSVIDGLKDKFESFLKKYEG